MSNSDIVLRFSPDKYIDDSNQEMLAVYNAQKTEVESYNNKLNRNYLNNLVKYTDKEGIKRFEDIFFIKADEVNDSLELRQQRVINKFASIPPFTEIFVKEMLKNIFGADKYEFIVYNNEYKVKVGIESDVVGLVTQVLNDIRQIIPANMTYETIVYTQYVHGYLKRHYTHGEMQQFTHGDLNNG